MQFTELCRWAPEGSENYALDGRASLLDLCYTQLAKESAENVETEMYVAQWLGCWAVHRKWESENHSWLNRLPYFPVA